MRMSRVCNVLYVKIEMKKIVTPVTLHVSSTTPLAVSRYESTRRWKSSQEMSDSTVKTKEIGLVMTESGLRRCGPVCGVREC